MGEFKRVARRRKSQPTIKSLLAEVVERHPIGEDKGYSGANVEKITLADGGSLVLKRISPTSDLSMQLSHDKGRAATLWTTGIYDRLPASVDHAMVAAERDGDGWILVMRDVSEALIPVGKTLSRKESHRIIEAMIAVHKTFRGQQVPGLTTLEDHYAMFTPTSIANIRNGNNVFLSWISRGWELFDQLAPSDVSSVVFALLDQPEILVRAFEHHQTTLIHADLYIENIGLYPDRVVMLDWSLATQAPSAVDFAAFLAMNGLRLDVSRDELLDDFRQISGKDHDEKALQVALVGALVKYCWRMSMYMSEWGDAENQPRIKAEFEWWMVNVRKSLTEHPLF